MFFHVHPAYNMKDRTVLVYSELSPLALLQMSLGYQRFLSEYQSLGTRLAHLYPTFFIAV